jgi:hypothetical protein
MTRDDIRKLLGGYATGTLTPEEQQALFAAALGDQELFDALAKEQSLRDLLRDPAARAEVLAALDDRPAPWWQWLMRPAAVGAMAAACLALAVGYGVWHARQAQRPLLVAANREVKVAPAPPEPRPNLTARAAAIPASHGEAEPAKADHIALDGLASTRAGEPARAEAPASLGAPPQATPSPPAVVFEKGLSGAPPPPPLPREFAAAPRPAVLKKEANAPAGAANQLVVGGNEFAPQTQQRGAAPSAPAQTQSGFTQARKDAAEANQLAMNGSLGQGGFQQTPQNQADQIGTQARSQSQTVQVQAEAPLMQSEQMADVPGALHQRRDLAAKPPGLPELKWSALRRARDGSLSPVALDRIRAGDAIVLRLEPYADGTLSVSETVPGSAAPRVLMAGTPVKRAQTVDTPPLTLRRPGVRELLVRFTAQTAAPPLTIVLRYR